MSSKPSPSIPFEVNEENRSQIFSYVQANPWVDVPKVAAWWLEQGEGNKQPQARAIVRSLCRDNLLIKRTSKTVHGPHGGFALEVFAKASG